MSLDSFPTIFTKTINDWRGTSGHIIIWQNTKNGLECEISIDKPENPQKETLAFVLSFFKLPPQPQILNFSLTLVHPEKNKSKQNNWNFEISRSQSTITIDTRILYNRNMPNNTLEMRFEIMLQPANLKRSRSLTRKAQYSGLKRHGNTCYMNSILQLVFHIPKLRDFIFSINIEQVPAKQKRFVFNLQKLFFRMQTAPLTSFSTEELTESLGWGRLALAQQCDAHEFHTKLWEIISNCVATQTNEESFFERTFGIEIQKEPINGTENKICTEKLYFIRANMEHSSLMKSIKTEMQNSSFTKLPPILQVLMSRAYFREDTRTLAKNTSTINFQFTLNLEKYSNEIPHEYELFSVVEHIGRTLGHYFLYARPTKGRRWVRFDDDNVYEAYETDIIPVSSVQRCQSQLISSDSKPESFQTSPCILTYIRKDCIEEFMTASEIVPEYIRLNQPYEKVVFKIGILSHDVLNKNMQDKIHGFTNQTPNIIDVCSSDHFNMIYRKVASLFNTDEQFVRLWKFSPDFIITDIIPNNEEYAVSLTVQFLYYEQLQPDEPRELPNDHIRVFLALYYQDNLSFLKAHTVNANNLIISLFNEVSKAANMDINTQYDIYIDNYVNLPSEIRPRAYFNDLGVKNGTTLIFSPISSKSQVSLINYFDYYFYSVDVHLFSFSNPGEEVGILHTSLNWDLGFFYNEIAKIANIEEEYESMLLFPCKHKYYPSTRALNPTTACKVRDILISNDLAITGIYYYTSDLSYEDIHTMLNVRISYSDDTIHRSAIAQVPVFYGTNAQNVLAYMQFKNIVPNDGNFRYRVITSGKIKSEIQPQDELDTEYKTLRIELIDNLVINENDTELECRLAQWHKKEHTHVQCFGEPFTLMINQNSSIEDIKLLMIDVFRLQDENNLEFVFIESETFSIKGSVDGCTTSMLVEYAQQHYCLTAILDLDSKVLLQNVPLKNNQILRMFP